MRDEVYRDKQPDLVDFAFDERVARVFPDMIRRSVPGYDTVVSISGLLAARHLLEHDPTPPGRIYDLGCSLGATAAATLQQLGDAPCELVAIDNAPEMLARGRQLLQDPRICWLQDDVRNVTYQPASVVLCNWLLQFLPPDARLDLLRRLREALDPGGLLVLSEKIGFDDPEEQRWFEARHLDVKRANGYSELEISQKRAALERVMRIDTLAGHETRLQQAGFRKIRPWFQCLNWVSLTAWP